MIIDLEKCYEDSYQTLLHCLWPTIDSHDIAEIMREHYAGKARVFLYLKDDQVVGFINTTVRTDYVEGASSSGVMYIEGIYVIESYRRNQIAYQLINHVKEHALRLGLTQMASDTELDNEMSQFFHKAIGFKEVNRIVHYLMNISEESHERD